MLFATGRLRSRNPPDSLGVPSAEIEPLPIGRFVCDVAAVRGDLNGWRARQRLPPDFVLSRAVRGEVEKPAATRPGRRGLRTLAGREPACFSAFQAPRFTA